MEPHMPATDQTSRNTHLSEPFRSILNAMTPPVGEILSPTLRDFDRRADLAKSDPLLALAYWIEAAGDRRIENDVCPASIMTDMRDRARQAIEQRTGSFLNRLYP